jgi:hypothetical protein
MSAWRFISCRQELIHNLSGTWGNMQWETCWTVGLIFSNAARCCRDASLHCIQKSLLWKDE